MSDPTITDGVLYGADEVVAKWVAERMGRKEAIFQPYVALGIVNADENDLVAGVVFHSYQPDGDITISAAADRPTMRRKALARVFGYAFNELNLKRVSAEVPLDNERSRKLVEGLGFVKEGAKRKATPNGRPVLVFGLLKKDFLLKGYL